MAVAMFKSVLEIEKLSFREVNRLREELNRLGVDLEERVRQCFDLDTHSFVLHVSVADETEGDALVVQLPGVTSYSSAAGARA